MGLLVFGQGFSKLETLVALWTGEGTLGRVDRPDVTVQLGDVGKEGTTLSRKKWI